jgi:predicted RNase H-like HicB family nuclease
MRHDYHVVYTTIEDGWIMATVPELPGAVTQGRDLDEARANIKEAIELLLQAYRDNAAKDASGTPCGKRSPYKSPLHETSRSNSAPRTARLLSRPRGQQPFRLPQPGQWKVHGGPKTSRNQRDDGANHLRPAGYPTSVACRTTRLAALNTYALDHLLTGHTQVT